MELQESEKFDPNDEGLLDTNHFVENSYILMVGYLISSIISTIGSILVIRLISIEEYSLVTIAFILPSILIPMGELGLNYASTNFIARKMKENDLKGVKSIIRINLIVKVIVGLIFTFLVIYFSVFIAKEIYKINDDRISILIQISAIAIISSILYDTINSFFIGAQKMRLVQYGAILRTVLRTFLSVFLVLIGLTIIGPILGYVLSSSIVVIIYAFFLLKTFKFNIEKEKGTNWKEFSRMIKYGYPLLIFSIIAGIQGQIFILILTVYGYLNEVSFFHLAIISGGAITILTKAISFSLFPIFSKMDWNNNDEQKTLINYFQFSIKFSTLLIVPVVILVILFSGDIFPIIYGNSYTDATPFISTYFLMFLLVSFGSLSIPAFFNGQRQTKYVLYITLIELSTSVIFALFLISYFGAIGLVYGVILGSIVSVLYGYIVIRKKYGKALFSNFKNVFLIFFIAIIIGVFIYYLNRTVLSILPIKGIVIRIVFLAISIIIYGIIFLFLIGILSLISIDEIDFLANSFQKFPLINKVIKILAKIEKKIITLRFKEG